jgi:hypothetical protein
MVSQIIGLNSSFIIAEVREPAIDWKEVLPFIYKIQFERFSLKIGTYIPPSFGIQFKIASAKEIPLPPQTLELRNFKQSSKEKD